jgi:hypothetical protein
LKESPVPIIAVCPYCQTGRVRAPEQAIGQATVCPRCHANFTVIDSGETEEVARRRVAAPSVPTPRPMPDSDPVPLDQTPTAVNETTAVITVERRIPTPAPVPVADDEETAGADPVRVATVIAFLLGGLGLVAAQLPYGRFGTVGACILGAFLGAAAAFGSRRPVYAIVAAALNGLTLLVALLLPGWLGLNSWRPSPTEKEDRTVHVVSIEGLEKPATDWLDISQTWQLDDVRAKASAAYGQVELAGPMGKNAWSKKAYIAVRVKIGNVGVAREIKFQGWDPAAVKLTDAAGTPIPPAKFESGWAPTEISKPASLTPGKSADWVMLFESPPNPTEYLRLELPGGPAGVTDSPIRFQIPARPLELRH